MSEQAKTYRRPRLMLWSLAALAVGLIAMSAWGVAWIRGQMQRSAFTETTRPLSISIGVDNLNIPANFFRFERQRQLKSQHDRVDLAMIWPSLAGYSQSTAEAFENGLEANSMLFLTLKRRELRLDMSGRLQPIYSKLFDGVPENGPAQLAYQRLKVGTGYDGEFLAVGAIGDQFWVARCQDQSHIHPTCIRDVSVGKDLTLHYRMAVGQLPRWAEMESQILERVSGFLAQ